VGAAARQIRQLQAIELLGGLRFFHEIYNAMPVQLQNPQPRRLLPADRQHRQSCLRVTAFVRAQHLTKIEPIELVSGKYQHMFRTVQFEVLEILPYRIGGALIPVTAVCSLFSC
jgi:hypothetical protein